MTLSRLAIRNAFLRNKTRTFLTVRGVAVAALAFVFLRTVLAACPNPSPTAILQNNP